MGLCNSQKHSIFSSYILSKHFFLILLLLNYLFLRHSSNQCLLGQLLECSPRTLKTHPQNRIEKNILKLKMCFRVLNHSPQQARNSLRKSLVLITSVSWVDAQWLTHHRSLLSCNVYWKNKLGLQSSPSSLILS